MVVSQFDQNTASTESIASTGTQFFGFAITIKMQLVIFCLISMNQGGRCLFGIV